MPYNMRAQAYIELDDYPAAIEAGNKAYEIILQRDLNRQNTIDTLGVLSLAYALNGDRTNAEKYATQLDGIGTYYPFLVLAVPKQLNLARTYMALHEYDKSLTAAQSATSLMVGVADVITGAALTGDSLFRWQELPRQFMINKSLFELKRYAEAKEGYLALLERPETKENGEIYWLILYDLGRIADSENRTSEAVGRYQEAIDVIERQRSTINSMASKIGFVGDKQQVYARLIADLVGQQQANAAFEYSERAKSRALVDMLASRTDFATTAASGGQVKTILGDLQNLEMQVASEDSSVNGTRRRDIDARIVQDKAQLNQVAPNVAALVTVSADSIADIRATLGPDETLVEYYQSGDDLFAFVLSKDDLTAVKLDGNGLVNEVSRVRAAFKNPVNSYKEASADSYKRLVEPLEPYLRTTHLVIVPHGVLHSVPFSALGNDKGMVVDRWTVRYLPSASVMKYIRPEGTDAQRPVLAIGNPDLGRPDLVLPGAQREAQQIGSTFPGSTVLIGAAATKDTFVKLSPDYRYLHLATHGLFDSAQPLTSGVFLAGASLNQGELTVEEIYTLRLNAEIVTLSACETGLGKINYGDDVIGLTEGFLYAGSRSIVASLWPVDDEGTLYLMTAFYQSLKTVRPEEALHQAQLAAKKRNPHPFYWAAFELTGAG
jgi:CHAT domain-containing protein